VGWIVNGGKGWLVVGLGRGRGIVIFWVEGKVWLRIFGLA